jgi:hypothetical protein
VSKRAWYEVRVREQVAPHVYVKKSKFWKVKSPQEARQKYKGNGHIMSVKKKDPQRPYKPSFLGGFLGLGDDLLQEYVKEGRKGADFVQKALNKEVDIVEGKVIYREKSTGGSGDTIRKEATNEIA